MKFLNDRIDNFIFKKLMEMDRNELTKLVKKLINEKHLVTQDIPNPDEGLFKEGLKRVRDELLKRYNNTKNYNDICNIEKLRENSCDGCVFLIRKSVSDNGDVYFEWICAFFNEYINRHGGSLAICAQHLPLCTKKFLDERDINNVHMFPEIEKEY